jgi:exosortase/archaeosortase family protein
MNFQAIAQKGRNAFEKGTKTTHQRIICAGLLVGLGYFPVWVYSLVKSSFIGTSDLFLVPALAYLGFQGLWQQRHTLDQQAAGPEDRFLGYMLVFTAVVAFPFCRFETWSQAVIWAIALLGIAISTWGLDFLKAYPLQCGLIGVSAYPNFAFVTQEVGRVVSPHNFLENLMAQSGGMMLGLIGHPATIKGNYIYLASGGGVEVLPACNGFDMAVTVATFGLVMGLFMKQPLTKAIAIAVAGYVLGLLFNVPRIVVLTFASVYWGKPSFDFWHGPIGGQIFSSILLTIFYYVAMGVMNSSNRKPTAE